MKLFIPVAAALGLAACDTPTSTATPIADRNAECVQLKSLADSLMPGPGNENPSQDDIAARVDAENRMRVLGCQFAPEQGPATMG